MKRPEWNYSLPIELFESIIDTFVVSMKPKMISESADRWHHNMVIVTGNAYGDEKGIIELSPSDWKLILELFDITLGPSLLEPNRSGRKAADRLEEIKEFDREYKDLKEEYARLKEIFE